MNEAFNFDLSSEYSFSSFRCFSSGSFKFPSKDLLENGKKKNIFLQANSIVGSIQGQESEALSSARR